MGEADVKTPISEFANYRFVSGAPNLYLGDICYLKTDPDQRKRIVVGIMLKPGAILYELAMGGSLTLHYDFEVSKEEDKLMKM